MSKTEVAVMDVDMKNVDAKKEKKSKKDKKSKKETKEEVPAAGEKRAAEEEAEDAPKAKKAKKDKKAATEEPATEKKAKKEKKSKKAKKEDAEEEVEAASPETKAPESDDDEEEKEVEEEKKEEETATEEKKEESTEEKSLEVFIGGLPYSATEETVKKDFEECGEVVKFTWVKDWEGNAKGIAFCEYVAQAGVDKALEFNETEYGGRTIYVRVNEKKGGKKGKGKDGKKGGKGGKGKGYTPQEPSEKPADCKSIILKGLSYDTTEESLWEKFGACGSIEKVKLLTDQETGRSRGMAFIDFDATEATDKAVADFCNKELDGRTVFVDFAGGAKGGNTKGKDGGKGKGKDGKGKGKKGGKKGKGKKGKDSDPSYAARNGSIQEPAGTAAAFDSDSD